MAQQQDGLERIGRQQIEHEAPGVADFDQLLVAQGNSARAALAPILPGASTGAHPARGGHVQRASQGIVQGLDAIGPHDAAWCRGSTGRLRFPAAG